MNGGAREGRWTKVALAVSLAVNLLVAGVVVGDALFDGRDHRRGGPPPGLRDIGTPFVMALEPENRERLMRRAAERAGPFRENREALRHRFERLLDTLRAHPFDQAATRAVLEEQRAALFERQALGEELLVEHLAAMSPEERAAFADRLDRSLRRRR